MLLITNLLYLCGPIFEISGNIVKIYYELLLKFAEDASFVVIRLGRRN